MPYDIYRGLEAGFYRYLAKPIKVAEFMQSLDEALELSMSARSDGPTSGNEIEKGAAR